MANAERVAFLPNSPSITVPVGQRLDPDELKAYAQRAVGRTVLSPDGAVLANPRGRTLPERYDGGQECRRGDPARWNLDTVLGLFQAIRDAYRL